MQAANVVYYQFVSDISRAWKVSLAGPDILVSYAGMKFAAPNLYDMNPDISNSKYERAMFILVPPFVAARKRNMHQALFVPEILLIIFKYITDDSGKPLLPTLAAVARTCRTFQHQAEAILWHKLPDISALCNILPARVRKRESRSWSVTSRMFSGSDWTRYLERASRVRVLVENAPFAGAGVHALGHDELFLAMASLRDPPLLTPNLRKLQWRTIHSSLRSAINLFISPSLLSLEIDVRLLTSRVLRVSLGDICPALQHLKIIGNGRCSAGTISSVVRGLHYLETVACPTLDDDAFIHLSQLKTLTSLAVDMRWSPLTLDALHDRLPPDSFQTLQTLHWKDYRLDFLSDIVFMPNISPPNIHLEIESFCTSSSLRTFLHTFAMKFPQTRSFSLVHDMRAGKRFGLQASVPGREHQLDAGDLEPLLALKTLRALELVSLGDIRLDNDLIKMIASALPELEQLHLRMDVLSHITFDGLLPLLQHSPKLQSLGVEVRIDEADIQSVGDKAVRHDRLEHLQLQGSVLGSRPEEVDKMLRRVLPRLRTIEESSDGLDYRVREVRDDVTAGGTYSANRTRVPGGGRVSGRRTRNSLESARGGG